ncbi:MAG: TrkA C-terminal domain-containing protein [Solirubrobacterales bacterium]
MVERNGEYLVPNGGTEFQPGDVTLVLGEKASLDVVERLLTAR